jgi:hypothetical protein
MSLTSLIRLIILLFSLSLVACSLPLLPTSENNHHVPILAFLSGDFPVAALDSLPNNQREASIGFLETQQQLDLVLGQIDSADSLSYQVDFSTQIVLFVRNTVFYNRLSIGQVTLEGDTLKVTSMQTMSAMPIRSKVAISMVVVPRQGATYLESGRLKIPLR